ncbi:MAG: PKD domain-containing protein [bacterium]
MRVFFAFFIGLGVATVVKSQDFSNKGTEFWVGYGSHVSMYNNNPFSPTYGQVLADGGDQNMVLYFTSDKTAQVKVEIPAVGWSRTYQVNPNQVTISDLIPKSGTEDARLTQEGLSKKGIHITSDIPIIAYAHIYDNSVSGATLLFPVNTLGRDYYSLNFKQIANLNSRYAYCYAYVVATEDDTNIEIILSANSVNRQKGDTIRAILKKGEIYNVLGRLNGDNGPSIYYGEDLTGTVIRSIATATSSCKRIAVFSGSGKVSISCNSGSGSADNYIQQAFPSNSWGRKYFTVPTENMPNNFFRVAVSKSSAVVKRNGVPLTGLINGFYYEYTSTSPDLIESDEPIMVAQYITTTGQCGNTLVSNGDPEMIYLSPIEQTINKVTLYSSPFARITNHFINIVIHKNGVSSLRVDGVAPIGTSAPFVQDLNYVYYQIPIGAAGSHTIQSDSGFNAIAYGYGRTESYGYNAGANVKDLYQTLSTVNQYATVNLPATCKGTPFKFVISLPYEPVSLEWIIPNYPAIPKINSPRSDSSKFINGKQIWYYSLPDFYRYDIINTYNIRVIANNPTTEGCTGEQQIDYTLQVFERPKAGFAWNTTNCIVDSVLMQDTSTVLTRPIAKYMWDLGDGNFNPIQKSFNHKFNAIGKNSVRFFSITDVGCLSDTALAEITLDSVPIPDFSIQSQTCKDNDIVFADGSKSTGGATLNEWHWNIPNTTPFVSTSNTSVTTRFDLLQQYTVGLKVRTANGCLSPEKQITFTNHPKPEVKFELPKICLPDGNGTFKDLSTIADGTSSLFKRTWNFGNPHATLSNPNIIIDVVNPSHRFSAIGPYDIKLVIESNNGCKDSLTQSLLDVYEQPKASFTFLNEVCLRESSVFDGVIDPGGRSMGTYVWTFSNGQTATTSSATVTAAAAGTYTATFYGFSADGCPSDSISRSFVVNPLPVADFEILGRACETDDVLFIEKATSAVGPVLRWNWRLGDAASPVDVLTSTAPVTGRFTSWGDQRIGLLVENSKGCKSDTLFKTYKIHPKPQVAYDLPEVCLNDAFANFISLTSIADHTPGIVNQWIFGDPNATVTNPNTATGQNVSHKYSAASDYTMSLTSISAAGCISTLTQTYTVNGATPVADFNIIDPTGLCSNRLVNIENTSTVDFGKVTKLEIYWDYLNKPATFITDEDPLPNKNYSHLYADFQNVSSKTFSVRLRAFSGISCVDDVIKTITVKGSPLVIFDPIPGICLEAAPRQITEAKFTDVTGVPNGSLTYSGTGSSLTGLFNPSASGVGTFPIYYRFTSSNGCYDDSTQSITVWPRPVADYSISPITCEKNPITFTSNSTTSVGTIQSWVWDFGDGSTVLTATNSNPVNHSYSIFNSYTSGLTVFTDNGCYSEKKNVTTLVNPLPRVSFDLPKVCLPEGKALFVNTTSIPDNTNGSLTYVWKFGDPSDGSTSVVKDGLYYYKNLGTYSVTLVSTSINQCVDSLTKALVDVFPQPKAIFDGPDSVCIGKEMKFNDRSDGVGSSITSWAWNFGNGDQSALQNPDYLYRSSGTYEIRLISKTDQGCFSDTARKQVIIHPYPVAFAGPDLFVLDDGQKPIEATASGSALSFSWSPGIYLNLTNVLQPLVVKPQEDQLYTLTVTGRGACSVTDEVKITVLRLPKPPNTFTPNGDGINDLWEIKYLDQYPGCIIEVYTTQGQLVYRSVNYNNQWDGKYKGNTLPVGTYYYVIDPKNGRNKVAGYVTILK